MNDAPDPIDLDVADLNELLSSMRQVQEELEAKIKDLRAHLAVAEGARRAPPPRNRARGSARRTPHDEGGSEMTITAEQAAKLLEGTTPGPWQADGAFTEDGCAVRIAMPDRNGVPMQTVAEAFYQQSDDEIYDGERRISWKEAEANARLIAAAPDLARALITSEAARKLAEERLAKAVEGLSALDKAAGEVARYGAANGSQWTRLAVAMLKTRAILKEIDNG